MQSLYYNGFEHIYDAMYQTFINYEQEYAFYSSILNKYKKESVLEIGCGSGHLASYFINSKTTYLGMDLSPDMVNLSQKNNPNGSFFKGNMTDFTLNNKIDSAIITARTISYLTTNSNLHSTLSCIHNNLKDKGLLCFDFIDAKRFFEIIENGLNLNHEASFKNKEYYRNSTFKPSKTHDNFMFHWDSIYYERTIDGPIKLVEDNSVVRAFIKEEIELLLSLNNFKLIEFVDRKAYAFDTYVVIAQKI
jgi:SAM-dependent methyltransferase